MGGAVISRYVFNVPRVSYDASMDHLVFIDCRIPAILLLQPGADRDDAFTIVFSHGNAEDLGGVLPWIDVLYDQCKFNICAWEYPGYGVHVSAIDGTPTTPTEAEINDDIYCVYKYLVNIKRINPANIILYGRSLGTGPTCALAARLCELETLRSTPQIGGIVLQSGFLSCLQVAGSFLTNFLTDMFNNERVVGLITCPALVVHGTRDSVVPIHHGEALAAAMPHLFKFVRVAGADHNNLEDAHSEELIEALHGLAAYIYRLGRRRRQYNESMNYTEGVQGPNGVPSQQPTRGGRTESLRRTQGPEETLGVFRTR